MRSSLRRSIRSFILGALAFIAAGIVTGPAPLYGPAPALAQQRLDTPGIPAIDKPLVAFAGDSICYAAIGANTATGTFNTGRGPSYWTRFLSNQRIVSPQALNFCVSGDTTNMLLARMGPILASGAADIYVMIGTNDVGAVSLATTQANIRSIVTQFLGTGARVHLSTVLPRQLVSATSRAQLLAINNFIRSLQGTYSRLYIFDPFLQYVDPVATDMAPRTSYAYDGLHPTTLGAYYAMQSYVAQINQQYVQFGSPAMATATDVFDATNNFGGNLVANGIMSGTGGTNGGGGGTISGTIADSWTLATSANGGTITSLTVTGSSVTLTDGRPAQRIVIGGTYSGAGSAAINQGTSVVFRQDLGSLNATNYPVGSQVVLTATYSVAASSANISGVECRISTTIGGTTYEIGDGSAYTSDFIPADAYSGTCMTEPFTIPSGTITLMRPSVRMYLRTAASQTPALQIDISSVKLYHPQ